MRVQGSLELHDTIDKLITKFSNYKIQLGHYRRYVIDVDPRFNNTNPHKVVDFDDFISHHNIRLPITLLIDVTDIKDKIALFGYDNVVLEDADMGFIHQLNKIAVQVDNLLSSRS